jgi:hypothetical protein
MATDFESSLRTAAEKVVKYLDDVTTLRVETLYNVVGEEGGPKRAALTEIKLDADSKLEIPLERDADNRLVIDRDLLDIHERSVAAATEYRARILGAVIGLLRSGRS